MTSLTLTLSGPDEVVAAGLDAFVRANGWTDGNESTQADYARDVIRRRVREDVTAYAVQQAQRAAAGAASEGTAAALDALTMTMDTGS